MRGRIKIVRVAGWYALQGQVSEPLPCIRPRKAVEGGDGEADEVGGRIEKSGGATLRKAGVLDGECPQL